MKPTIYLALTDDWELRGNGSGTVEALQLRPMRELVGIYTRYGVRATFNVEVMQQLTFRKFESRFPELKSQADSWDEHVREAYRQGQDIQLHLHPQWSEATYTDGRWRLAGDWSILNYEPEAAYSMLAAGKEYLEKLLRPIDASYRCLSFRAGSSVIAPSPFILSTLARLGIVFDMSIVGGMRVHTRNVQLDYTEAEESFLPFYPRMEDARRVSEKKEPIICVPIFHFYGSRRRAAAQIVGKALTKARHKISSARSGGGDENESYASQEWADTRDISVAQRVYEKALQPCLKGRHLTADIGQLDDADLREMLDAIRRRARATGLGQLPVILTNHTKYVRDFTHIERFLKRAAASDDIQFATLTDIAEKLRAGEFQARTLEKSFR